MPKIINTEIAKWIKTRFNNDNKACKLFDITIQTLIKWKKQPPALLILYAEKYEENLKNKELIEDLQNEIHLYRMKLGYIMTKEVEDAKNKRDIG